MSSRGIEYKMQFFKTSYETRPGISALRRASRWYLCVNASLFKEKRNTISQKHFSSNRERETEKNLREHSKKHLIRSIDHVVLANELFIHPYFLPFFYDRLYTRARVCRFQYNATEIIRPIVMKRKWKKFRISVVDTEGTRRDRAYIFLPGNFSSCCMDQKYFILDVEKERLHRVQMSKHGPPTILI